MPLSISPAPAPPVFSSPLAPPLSAAPSSPPSSLSAALAPPPALPTDGGRAWTVWAIGQLNADAQRSADTHLVPVPLPVYPDVDFYFKDHSIYSAGEYDMAKEVAAMSIVKEIVDRKGGWIYYGERKWNGQEALVNSIREEVELFEELRDKVLTTPTSILGAMSDE
jgi:hypothetical protein